MMVARSIHRRPGGTLYRYLIREMIVPSALALGGFTLVVLTNDLLGFSELVINRGVSAATVLAIAGLKAIPVAAQMLPFAVLVGALIALGRLGADLELLTLEASGISSPRLLGPVMTFAGGMTVIALALSVYSAPWANRELSGLLEQVARSTPGATIEADRTNYFGDWRLQAREVSASGTDMRGILLFMPAIGETVFAEHGRLVSVADREIQLVLENGAMLPDPRVKAREVRFERLVASLPQDEQPVVDTGTNATTRATLRELAERILPIEADPSDAAGARGSNGHGQPTAEAESETVAVAAPPPPDSAQEALIELNRRFALPFATIVFGLLVLPLFLARAHFSRAGGAGLGILGTLVYYGLAQLGEGLVQSGVLGVAMGVWLPNVVLGAVALLLIVRLTRMSAFGRHSERDRPRSKEPKPPKAGKAARLRFHRWPLERYVAGRFLQMALLCFVMLLVAYLLVDILERMSWLAKHGASATELLTYFGARLPLLASRVLPMALLAATALTVSLLAVQGELMGMRACGIPAPRALMPVLVICAIVTPGYFLLNNEVLPKTNQIQALMKQVVKGPQGRSQSHGRFWHLDGSEVYEVDTLDTQHGRAENLTMYRLDEEALPVSRADAREARHIGGGIWRLSDHLRVEVAVDGVREVPAAPFAQLGETLSAKVDTRHMSLGDVGREISELEGEGYDATAFRVDYQLKLATPIACLVLPALALFFAVTGPPFPSSALTLVLSAFVAVAYVLLTGVGASLGHGKAVSPIVAAWGPIGFFAVLAAWLGLRARGIGRLR